MDSFTRQRRGSGGRDIEVPAGASEPDYQAALGQEDSEQQPAPVRLGEMSPGMLEQGGVPAEPETPANLFVASPFHSEKVKSEVELLRSRPATLDDDGRRAGIDYDEAALGDSSFLSGGREPDYSLAGHGSRGGAPKLARVEIAGEHAVEQSGEAEEQKPGIVEVQPETGRGWEITGKGRGANPRDGSASTFAGEKPGASDARELIPDSGFSRMEQMMLQVMQENAALRQRLEAVESQSSGLSGGTCVTALEAQVSSPMSFAGNVQSCVAAPRENRLVQMPSAFPGNDFQGSELSRGWFETARVAQPPGMCPPPCGALVGSPTERGGSGQGFEFCRVRHETSVPFMPGIRSPPPRPPSVPLRTLVERDEGWGSGTQTLGQFASFALASREGQGESGYHTPRSVGASGLAGFSSDGYPLSPGGTVIRPPPGPPPMSPRGVQAYGSGHLGANAAECGVMSGGSRGPGYLAGVEDFARGEKGIPSQGVPGSSPTVAEGISSFSAPGAFPEEPAKYIIDLPKLAAADLTTSAVTCGNWLAQTRQVFAGLSPSASVWFSSVEGAANASYQRWLVADPLERLALDPSTVVAHYDAVKYQRVESRAVSLLLSCVPQSFKDELVTNRWMTTASILYRILCVYQPGGSTERAYLLSRLVQPDPCKSFKDAISGLRRWQQDLIRAREIQATLPDPSLLLKGIDAATSSLLALQPMVAFRVSVFRHKSSIDYNPSVTGVTQLVKLIQAECESLAMTVESPPDKKARAAAAAAAAAKAPDPKLPSTSASSQTPSPTVAAVFGEADAGKGKGKSSKGSGSTVECFRFGDGTGCRFGDSCTFRHDRAKARRQSRCLACGQSGHYRPDCPIVPAELRQVLPEGGSPSAKSPPSPKKSEAKPKPKSQPQAKGISEDAPSGSAGARNSEASSASGAKEALFAEAAKLLQGASAKVLRVGEWNIDETWLCSAVSASNLEYALIDSGATNALRFACSEELRGAESIRVDLASGVTELHVNEYGTLLSPVDCQLILPAGYLVSMGYRISWGKKGCRIRHPKLGELEVSVVKGCPLVPRELGMRLLDQYERFRAGSRSVKGLTCSEAGEQLNAKEVKMWLRDQLKQSAAGLLDRVTQVSLLRSVFPGISDWVLERTVVDPEDPFAGCQGVAPWNRRLRRSVDRDTQGSVLLRVGAVGDKWKGPGRVVELRRDFGSDLGIVPVFLQVLKWAQSGVLGGIVASTEEKGFELGSSLSDSEKEAALRKQVSWFRLCLVYMVAQAAAENTACEVTEPREPAGEGESGSGEPPQGLDDPHEIALWALRRAAVKLQMSVEPELSDLKGGPRAAESPPVCKGGQTERAVFFVLEGSFDGLTRPEEVEGLREAYGLYRVSFDQGCLGNLARDSTVLVTSSWDVFESLHALRVPEHIQMPESSRINGSRVWAPGLIGCVKNAWEKCRRSRLEVGDLSERRALLAKLTEEESLRRHRANDHIPFRRGCGDCIAAQGRQRSHWRSRITTLYSLSVDIAGPFKDGRSFDPIASGRDRGRGYKYFIAAAYSIPLSPELRPDLSPPDDLAEYCPSECEQEAAGVGPIADEASEDCSEWLDGVHEQIAGGFSSKALFRRVRGKTFPRVDPLQDGAEFAERKAPGPDLPGNAADGAEEEPKVVTKTLFLGIPLRTKRGSEVMGQVQALVNRLESFGYPVHRYFADRAKELRSHALIQWLRERGIRASFTAGEDPAGNKAEVSVQRLKQDARKLLRVADLPIEFWPFAILHASQRHFVQMAEALGVGQAVLLPFGVWLHARKRLKSGHKKHWETRTVPGKYLGVATDCAGGHLVLIQDGSEQRVLLTNTVYPVDPLTVPKPKFRLTTKTPPGFAVRAVAAKSARWPTGRSSVARFAPGGECVGCLRDFESSEGPKFETGLESGSSSLSEEASDGDLGVTTDEEGFQELQVDGTTVKLLFGDSGVWLGNKLETGDYSTVEALEVLRRCADKLPPPNRRVLGGKGRCAVMGLYNQGGFQGVSRFAKDHGDLVRYLNKFVRAQGCEHPYTTLYLTRNTSTPLHQDARNERVVPVWVIALGEFQGGGLWVESSDGQGPVLRQLPGGDLRAGFVRDIHDNPCTFSGQLWHCAEPWCGKDRWVIAAYAPRGTWKILNEYARELESLGFDSKGLDHLFAAERASISKFNAEGDEDLTSEGLWEVEFPCEVLKPGWREHVLRNHLSSALACKALVKELSCFGNDDVGYELIRTLKSVECQREWYEGLLWDDFVRNSGSMLKALNQDVPLNPEDQTSPAEAFLQTRTVSLAEAKGELVLWIPSATEEVVSLEQTNEAVERIVVSDIERLIQEGKRVTQVPGKAVLTRKAGVGKRRFRCVACGNYIPTGSPDSNNLYASGVESLTVRTALGFAAYRGWAALSADIRTAFLHAPLDGELESEEIIIVRPPSILVDMKILSPNHRWRVRKALYGLRQAPLAWARFRDKSLRVLTFQCDGAWYALQQGVSDDSLWFITKSEIAEDDTERWHGILIIYVDDLLGFASSVILSALFDEIQKLWKLSEPEWIREEAATKFCGLEIQALQRGGYRISQVSYLQELFARYDVTSSASAPLSNWTDPENEQQVQLETVRKAQALTGALLWASSKTRPDIAFAVSKLGQYAVKAPSIVIESGHQILRYLYGTADLWLEYQKPSDNSWLDAPVPRTLNTLELYTDASHAPNGGRSCQAMVILWGGNVLCWESCRQPFVTLSSTEAELVAVTAGIVAAESIGGIIEEMIESDITVSALCDNQAAVRSFAVGSLGWRNRHLRMRAAAGRERIDAGSLVVTYVPGSIQLADIATKPLSRARILQLAELMNMRMRLSPAGADDSIRTVSRLSSSFGSQGSVSPRTLAGLALVAVLSGVRAQPALRVEERIEWILWFFGVLVGLVLLAWAQWFLGLGFRGFWRGEQLRELVGDAVSLGGLEFAAEAQQDFGVGNEVSLASEVESRAGSEGDGSEQFSETELLEAQRKLQERERSSQQVPPTPDVQIGGSNSSQQVPPSPDVQIGGSNSSQQVPPSPDVQIGGSSSSQQVPPSLGVQIGGSSSSQQVPPSLDVQIGGGSRSLQVPPSGVESLTVRTALSLAAYRGLAASSADVRAAFLHAPLNGQPESEEIVTAQSPSISVLNLLDLEDDPTPDDRPHRAVSPRVPVEGQFFLGEGWSSSESESGDSTTEPSIFSVSSGDAAVDEEVWVIHDAEARLAQADEPQPLGVNFRAGHEVLIGTYADDEVSIALQGWSQAEVETIVTGLNEGEWTSFHAMLAQTSNQESQSSTQVQGSQSVVWVVGVGVGLSLVGAFVQLWSVSFVACWFLLLWCRSKGDFAGTFGRIWGVRPRSDRRWVVLLYVLWLVLGGILPSSAEVVTYGDEPVSFGRWDEPTGSSTGVGDVCLEDEQGSSSEEAGSWDWWLWVACVIGIWEIVRALSLRVCRSRKTVQDQAVSAETVPWPLHPGIPHRANILYCYWRAGYVFDVQEYPEAVQSRFYGLLGSHLERRDRDGLSSTDSSD